MRNFIREHLKGFIGITALLICTIALIGSSELIAKMLPDASELTGEVAKSKNGETYEYTGEEITPEFSKLVFTDRDGKVVTVDQDDFAVSAYFNNVEIGYGDIEVSLEGYRNSVVFEDAFQIVLGQVDGLVVSASTKENVDLVWKEVVGADGYVVCKSTDKGDTYTEIQTITDGSLTYQDIDVVLNSTYMYQVYAFKNMDSEVIYGEVSKAVKHITPLADPVAKSAEKVDYQSIKVTWDLVPGAVGYQVFRATEEAGEYTLIGEITDRQVNTYTDSTCEIGVPYFYHVVACQEIDETIIYGTPSNVVSASTTPNAVSLSGSANVEMTTAVLKWKEIVKADGYEVYKDSGSGYTLVKTFTDGTLTWIDSGLTDTAEYSYKVRAYTEVDGKKIFGSYSSVYTKSKKIVYNYSGSVSGGVSALTKYVGYEYVYGGKSPNGWDCSGFTSWVMRNEYGINMSLSAVGQASGGTPISVSDRSSWKAGDILCYTDNGKVSHVAIYLGGGQMIHALNSKYDTFIQSVDKYETWDDNTLTYVRRY